jgi:XTP/dITP diphosphohydrolase
MFVPDGMTRTFAEITPEVKHAVSHRARAFARFAEARLAKSGGLPAGAAGISARGEERL